MGIFTRFIDFVNESRLLEHRKKSEHSGQYAIFKITFSDGETHYGQVRSVIDPEGYLSNLKSTARSNAMRTTLQKKILVEEPNPLVELVYTTMDEDEAIAKIREFIKNDPNSMNVISMVGVKKRSGTKNIPHPVPINKILLSQADNKIFVAYDYVNDDPEMMRRIDPNEFLVMPVSGKKYFKVKNKNNIKIISASPGVISAGAPEQDFKELYPTEDTPTDYIKQYFGLGKYAKA